ncbi:MAG: glycosyltransferase family 4 protein [Proteobacteria bacterium]|nr:glycosyltransferase family 4 protein [Pseudomonadota bacterium]
MHILFLTHYFPPEVNAPASRTFENARRWVKAGHRVTVLTCVPNHPKGVVYTGYKNRLYQWEEVQGIRVLRVGTYLSPNEGFLKRTANYVSYMISATLLSPLVKEVDIVVSTSPQFFCGMAGYFVSRIKRCKWVLEIRDLWPESIVTVGAIKQRQVINLLEGLERFFYLHADHIISLTHAFKSHIMKKSVSEKYISIVTNGADLEMYTPLPRHNAISKEYGLDDTFVVSYIGTHGMAHALRTVLKAGKVLEDKKGILFLLVGDGAERETLLKEKERMGLSNVLMLPQQPKDKMPGFLAASDVSMILLKKDDLFKTVIPSKMFEAMAMGRPIIIGVDGESRQIVEDGQCGIYIEPENHEELANTVVKLFHDRELLRTLGENGKTYVKRNYNRELLAEKYLNTLLGVHGDHTADGGHS